MGCAHFEIAGPGDEHLTSRPLTHTPYYRSMKL